MQGSCKSEFKDNPIVYHLMTDRFLKIDDEEHSSTAERLDASMVGSYHGGNYQGIIAKIEEGWFDDLGINALWITAPYEQIHGWVAGGHAEFKHESYHGYWVLDYTTINQRFGSESDFAMLVATAHVRGIKIIVDVVVGHAGYWDLRTLNEYVLGATKSGWQEAGIENVDDFINDAPGILDGWWGKEWVYANLPGYIGEANGGPALLHGLPKFRTDNSDSVKLPRFLSRKPDTRAADMPNTSVSGYITTWLSDWVAKYGIDGFRCDSVPHVEDVVWRELKAKTRSALKAWKSENCGEADSVESFWMTGEIYGNGIEYSKYYEGGFDSLINFCFQNEVNDIFRSVEAGDHYGHSLAMFRLDSVYSRYANELNGVSRRDVLSYISSHDTGLSDRQKLFENATALMLAPGGVQMLYGDETARQASDAPKGDAAQSYRSYMNWHAIDHAILIHWQRLGQFRKRHVAIARGTHRRLKDEPYVFVREDLLRDDIVILGIFPEPAAVCIDVDGVFQEGELLNDAYSGKKVIVRAGQVRIDADRVLLLERAEIN